MILKQRVGVLKVLKGNGPSSLWPLFEASPKTTQRLTCKSKRPETCKADGEKQKTHFLGGSVNNKTELLICH